MNSYKKHDKDDFDTKDKDREEKIIEEFSSVMRTDLDVGITSKDPVTNVEVQAESRDYLFLPNHDTIETVINSPELGVLNSTIEDGFSDVSNEKDWSDLPSLVVEKIYSFLPRPDQSRMSLACSRWSQGFSSPEVWKTLKFHLPRRDYKGKVYPEVKFANRYAPMLQHIEIIVKSVHIYSAEEIFKQLLLFLNILKTSCQLRTVKFINMNNYLYRKDFEERAYLLEIIIDFFHSQNNLTSVAIIKSMFHNDYATELLKAIFHCDKHSIKRLKLQKFAYEDQFTILSQDNRTFLSEVSCRIAKVQVIEIEYTKTFEEFINCLYDKINSGDYKRDERKSSISTLNILCQGKRHMEFRGISSTTWTRLRSVFKDLEVKVHIKIETNPNNEIKKYLAENMPLRSLNIEFKKMFVSSRADITSLFTPIITANLNTKLENLSIIYKAPIRSFYMDVVPFIQNCDNLREVELYVTHVPSELENCFRDIYESHPPRLNQIKISFDYLRNNQLAENLYQVRRGEYYLLLRQSGIDCKLFYRSHDILDI